MADARRPAATLTMTRGPDAGRRFGVGMAPVTIGRQDQCEVQVAGTWVSRRHARLAWTGTGYIVEDLGSTNGTFVNGEQVSGPRMLQSGDRLQLGEQVEFAFEAYMPALVRAEAALPGMAPPQAQAPPPRPERRRIWIWALGLLGLLVVIAAAGVGAWYLLSDKEQWVVFASTQSDTDEDDTSETSIFIMHPDGTELSQVTTDSGSDWSPDLSPDGQTVLFVSGRDSESSIYRIDVDGTGLEHLTPEGGTHSDPSWSPDGEKIVFVSDQDDEGAEIYTMNADGSDVERLTDHEYGCRDPEWSPDGEIIAYACFGTGGGFDIFVMNADGSDSHRVTEAVDLELEPSWSPDGKRIAYSAWYMGDVEEGRSFTIFTLTNSRKLMLLFTGSSFDLESLTSGIHTIAVDGSDRQELVVTKEHSNWSPAWSPDGETILFASDRDGDADIYAITLDSLELTNITDSTEQDYTPSW
ncbi:MAG: FHA domain-containing protein [Anaerolineae bacterium]|jgi:Tol biopolymer transport system component